MFLSSTRKEVMLTTILTAISTYALSCFQLSEGLCKKITSILSNFWRSQRDGKRKIYFEYVNQKPIGGGGGVRL
ncbi:hypothetical protein RDI58_015746 [Solanum bulbocastanum]|uniref:Uncharacterized protein n=1 Tax=Solanum bulbocastanum TaxID=147425 RepID=A0AAN8TNW9_SOLBU